MALVTTCLLLGACTTGNERATLGNGETGNTASLPEFVGRGDAPPPASTGTSIEGLSRANWAPMYVVVPADGLAFDENVPLADLRQAGEDFEQRRFSAAGRPDDGEEFASA